MRLFEAGRVCAKLADFVVGLVAMDEALGKEVA